MGKVYVLAKAETPPMVVQGAGGGGNAGGLLMNIQGNIAPKDAARSVMEERYGKQNIPVRQSPSPKYTPSQLVGIEDKTSGIASKFGKYGGIAGALAGGINSFYNASSSGQPGALGAAAMGGWTGQQLAQPYATKIGAQVGVRAGEKAVDRDMAASQGGFDEAQRMNQGLDGFKGSQSMKPMSFESSPLQENYDEAQRMNQQHDAMSMLPEYNRQMNFNQNKVGVTQPPAVSPQIGNQPGQLGYTPGRDGMDAATFTNPNFTQSRAGLSPNPPTISPDNSTEGNLGSYSKVGVKNSLTPEVVGQVQNETGLDAEGNYKSGSAKQQG